MAISPARAAAFDILLRIEQQDAYASELLHSSQYTKLSAADHGLATELVMGVLRWRSLLDLQIAQHSSQRLQKLDAEVLTALRLAAYQLSFLDRIPERAAVHESVELVKRSRKRSAVPFANAVLRKLSQASAGKSESIPAIRVGTIAELAESSAHPLWLVERWAQQFGLHAAQQICEHNQRIPETAIRLASPAIEKELAQEDVALAPGQLLASARRVQSGDVTQTSAFREGRVSIQDEASQLTALLVGHASAILDCCAAPGGKTRILASQNPNAIIIAAELHPHRARLLRKLVPEKNVQVIAADVRQFPVNKLFESVLVDVPCSGTGTLARNPEIKWRLRPEDLMDLQSRQLAILQSAMTYVAPGGRLVYSTCSLEPEENSAVVEKALAVDPSLHVVDCHLELERLHAQGDLAWPDLDSLTLGPYLRTIPGVHPGDGFFAAILEKV
ncbi:MAG: 16S rRNA (cytosine(967)-C(5))-methyltransferase RsmB [Terriglobales bacterium]